MSALRGDYNAYASAMAQLPLTIAEVELQYQAGFYPGAQLYVSLSRTELVNASIGTRGDGHPLRTTTPLRWLCGTKPVVAAAVLAECEKGRLNLDARVSQYLGEFVGGWRDQCTLRDLLTHSVPFADDPALAVYDRPWNDVVHASFSAAIDAPVGSVGQYTNMVGWMIVAEVLQRVTGCALEDHVRETVFEPLDMRSSYLQGPGEPRSHSRLGSLLFRRFAERWVPAIWFEHPRLRGARWPGMGGLGPACDLGRFYEFLVLGPEGDQAPVISDDARSEMTSPQRVGLVERQFRVRGSPLDVVFGLGVCVDGRYFGLDCGPTIIGHKGYFSSMAVADPDTGVVMVYLTNGVISEDLDQQRCDRLIDALRADLSTLE